MQDHEKGFRRRDKMALKSDVMLGKLVTDTPVISVSVHFRANSVSKRREG